MKTEGCVKTQIYTHMNEYSGAEIKDLISKIGKYKPLQKKFIFVAQAAGVSLDSVVQYKVCRRSGFESLCEYQPLGCDRYIQLTD